jgi:hypothetical protein
MLYTQVSRVVVSKVYVWVLNTYTWVLNEYVQVLNAYARVSRVAVSRARESGQMGWESESETHES